MDKIKEKTFGGINFSICAARQHLANGPSDELYLNRDGKIYLPTNWAGRALVWVNRKLFSGEQKHRYSEQIGNLYQERMSVRFKIVRGEDKSLIRDYQVLLIRIEANIRFLKQNFDCASEPFVQSALSKKLWNSNSHFLRALSLLL